MYFHTELAQPSQQGLSTFYLSGVEAQVLDNQAVFSILYVTKGQEYEISPYFPDEVPQHTLSLSVRLKSPVICWIL